jgi:hypothetical protein
MINERLLALRRRAARRAGDEDGFTMIVAMMVLMVVTLLIGAAFVAANGDVHNTRHDLDGKRAYYAARAGLSRFLYLLNKDNELWQTCPKQTTTTVPGTAASEQLTYSYDPMPANGQAQCLGLGVTGANPVGTFIDAATGSFRMRFTGTSGSNPPVSRTIVAQFKRRSPLDYLYYSKYETLDPNTYSNPAYYQDCAAFIRQGRPSKCGYIQWVSGDTINGPLYTQDQYVICGSPTFGRPNTGDLMQSAAPEDPNNPTVNQAVIKICSGNPTYNGDPGNPYDSAGTIDPPSDNTNLLPSAQSNGRVYTGRTFITFTSDGKVSISNASVSNGAAQIYNQSAVPIIYVSNGSGCSATYSPYFGGTSNYTNPSTCGNALVSGYYTSSVTVAAANDIVIKDDLTTNLNGSAVAGLVANNFIRVQHAVTTSRTNGDPNNCNGADNISSYSHNDIEIDAALLALQHSFIVDNYDCGDPLTGHLNVTGAIAQIFRGTVGTGSGGNSVNSGYLKDYNYDDRLAVLQPPYLFDLASSAWKVIRETSCTPGSSTPALAC